MSKAILISIKPKYVAKILNGEKTIEIRKTMPKCDLPIDVYIYCTKEESLIYEDGYDWKGDYVNYKYYADYKGMEDDIGSGKIVAKFTLNKVEEIVDYGSQYLINKDYPHTNEVARNSCLYFTDLKNYLKGKNGYAFHISNLVIFDRPKELSEFYGKFNHKRHDSMFGNNVIEIDKEIGGLRQPIRGGYEWVYPLTKAPQSWCYVEVLS